MAQVCVGGAETSQGLKRRHAVACSTSYRSFETPNAKRPSWVQIGLQELSFVEVEVAKVSAFQFRFGGFGGSWGNRALADWEYLGPWGIRDLGGLGGLVDCVGLGDQVGLGIWWAWV